MQLSEYGDEDLIEALAERGIYVISLEEVRKLKDKLIADCVRDSLTKDGVNSLFKSTTTG